MPEHSVHTLSYRNQDLRAPTAEQNNVSIYNSWGKKRNRVWGKGTKFTSGGNGDSSTCCGSNSLNGGSELEALAEGISFLLVLPRGDWRVRSRVLGCERGRE